MGIIKTENAIIDLRNIERRFKYLKTGLSKDLIAEAQATKIFLKRNWLAGKGGDEKAMKGLTPRYKRLKTSQGGKGIPDLIGPNTKRGAGGQLQSSMVVIKKSSSKVIITFSGNRNLNVARGLIKKRRGMMMISEKQKRRVIKNIYKRMTKGGIM